MCNALQQDALHRPADRISIGSSLAEIEMQNSERTGVALWISVRSRIYRQEVREFVDNFNSSREDAIGLLPDQQLQYNLDKLVRWTLNHQQGCGLLQLVDSFRRLHCLPSEVAYSQVGLVTALLLPSSESKYP